MHNRVFISANFEPKQFGWNFRFSANFRSIFFGSKLTGFFASFLPKYQNWFKTSLIFVCFDCFWITKIFLTGQILKIRRQLKADGDFFQPKSQQFWNLCMENNKPRNFCPYQFILIIIREIFNGEFWYDDWKIGMTADSFIQNFLTDRIESWLRDCVMHGVFQPMTGKYFENHAT